MSIFFLNPGKKQSRSRHEQEKEVSYNENDLE